MDLENGFMARNLPENVEYIPYDKTAEIPDNSIVIIQSCPLWRIPGISNFPLGVKILLWNLHPDNLNPALISTSGHRNKNIAKLINVFQFWRKAKIASMVKLLKTKRAIYFMDNQNFLLTANNLNMRLDKPDYLPICTDEAQTGMVLACPGSNELKCVWVGRIDDFKVPILIHTIRRLNQIYSISLSLDIIGDGPMMKEILKESEKCSNLKIRFLGAISFTNLDETLSKYQLLIAMGTSSLEGAKIGLPTICVDYSYKKIENIYCYKMLYENKGYNLAEEITSAHYEKESSLADTLQNIIDNYPSESSLCHGYWEKHHSPERVVEKFLHAVDNSNCKLSHLLEIRLHKPDIITQLREIIKTVCGLGKRDEGWVY